MFFPMFGGRAQDETDEGMNEWKIQYIRTVTQTDGYYWGALIQHNTRILRRCYYNVESENYWK